MEAGKVSRWRQLTHHTPLLKLTGGQVLSCRLGKQTSGVGQLLRTCRQDTCSQFTQEVSHVTHKHTLTYKLLAYRQRSNQCTHCSIAAASAATAVRSDQQLSKRLLETATQHSHQKPLGQSVHDSAPSFEYLPAGHAA